MSAIRLSLGLENFHIFNKECEKHFLYVCCTASKRLLSVANLENFSQTNNTQWDIVSKKAIIQYITYSTDIIWGDFINGEICDNFDILQSRYTFSIYKLS